MERFRKKTRHSYVYFPFHHGVNGLMFPKKKIPDLKAFEKMLDQYISFHAQVGNEIKL